MVFSPEKLKTLFSKFAKNEAKAVKVAVLAAPCNVLVAPRGMLALQDTHGNSRGPTGSSGGKKFYVLELLKS